MFKDKVVGSLVGLTIGDALGTPYEFKTPLCKVKDNFIKGGVHTVSIGEWIDVDKSKDSINQQMKTNIHILVGDITTVNTDAIVNPANFRLLGGGGVDGAIHRAGGQKILEECQYLRNTKYPKGLPIGEAVITSAGNLKAKYVIHTVGPQYRFDENPSKSLESAYRNSFLLADNHKCQSIAFPSIATGVYAYPKEEAAKIAYEAVSGLLTEANYIKDVVFVFYSEKDANIFKKINGLI